MLILAQEVQVLEMLERGFEAGTQFLGHLTNSGHGVDRLGQGPRQAADEFGRHEQHCGKSVSPRFQIAWRPRAARNREPRTIAAIEENMAQLMSKREPATRLPQISH